MSSGAPFKTRTYKRSPFEREKLKRFFKRRNLLDRLGGKIGRAPDISIKVADVRPRCAI